MKIIILGHEYLSKLAIEKKIKLKPYLKNILFYKLNLKNYNLKNDIYLQSIIKEIGYKKKKNSYNHISDKDFKKIMKDFN